MIIQFVEEAGMESDISSFPKSGAQTSALQKFAYDNVIVRNFAYATAIWSIVGILVGLIIALKLVFPNFLGFIP
jgi:cytochrome c oxidase cbb3-type subunit I/II